MLNTGSTVLLCVFLFGRTTVTKAAHILKLDNPTYAVFSASTSNIHRVSVKDTLIYLQSIVANKANYIGQPFSVLLNNLQIQIKHFSPIADVPDDKNKETATFFSFYFPQSAEEIYLTYPCLRISWQTSLNAATSRSLYKTNNGGGWTQAVVDFYKNAIITDIDIFE